MNYIDEWIIRELERCKTMHYRLAKRLGRIDVNSNSKGLNYSIKNGTKYYSETWTEGGKQKRKYLGTADNPDVRRIQEIHFLNKALRMLDDHMDKISRCQEEMHRFELEMVNDSLPGAYRLSKEQIMRIIGPDEESRWYKQATAEKRKKDAKYGAWHPAGRKHKAKDGTLVRSKSEVLIANELFNRGKPYIYEMPIEVGQLVLHPDFAFYSRRFARQMILEHVGMLGDELYSDRFTEKVDTYSRNGFVPCVDVLFTFETLTGDIDAGIVSRLLDEYQ